MPTATATADASRERAAEIATQISAGRSEEQSLRAQYETARDKFVADPRNPTLREEAEGYSRQISEKQEELANLRAARDMLLSEASQARDADTLDDRNVGFGMSDRDSLVTPEGLRALSSDEYGRLKAQGAFTVSGRKSIDAILVQRQYAQDGTNLSREALVEAFQTGDFSRLATLVTGVSQTSGGAMVTPQRLPGLTVPFRTRPLRLVDLITVGRTDSDTIEYVEMTGFTNNAAETAEATLAGDTSGTKPESAIALVERQVTVKTVAHWIPATKRALADAGQLRTLIDQILRLGLDIRLDTQIASGNGTGENFRGIYNTAGIGAVTRVVPATTNSNTPETILDVIHRAITTVRNAFFEPNALGIHPTDYERLRLVRETAAVANINAGAAGSYGGGGYLMGDPMADGTPPIWGLRPIVSSAFTAGTPIVGDFNQIVLWMREGTQVLASDSHNDYFVRNLVAILAEFRAALGVLAPAAFATAAL